MYYCMQPTLLVIKPLCFILLPLFPIDFAPHSHMGQCYARSIPVSDADHTYTTSAGSPVASYSNNQPQTPQSPHRHHGRSPRPTSKPATPSRTSAASAAPSPWLSPLPAGIAPSPARSSTPRRFFRRPFPPPSPAKHIKASLAKRAPPTPDHQVTDVATLTNATSNVDASLDGLDKSFGFGRNFGAKYELGKEVGRGHFGHTSIARAKKGEFKGQLVAVKTIPKSKMTSAIAIEDVRREVKMLKALSGHEHTVKFYDACEDADNVYIVMELCEGGELLDRILSRGGRYTEEDAKAIVVQILNVVSFCHLQGVVHRDLKPENFLFNSRDENSALKIIDFGLSDFVRPDERLNDIVGSVYYVAPEVLHRSYSTEADMWSIGVITYILLCGSRPFWARTESGIFRSVLRADPNYDDSPWPSITPEAKDFVRRFLNKDYRKRMTAAQALTHPWLRDQQRQVPLDLYIYKLVKAYLRATTFKRAALKALSKAITEDEVIYIRSQYDLLEPSKDGRISLDNFRSALLKNATDAMRESRVHEILNALEPLSYRKMDFEEFCAATISPYQLEALQDWEHIATTAFEYFELDGNRVIKIEELANEMNLSSSAYSIIRDWIRPSDGKLSFLGYTKFLHGVTIRNSNARRK